MGLNQSTLQLVREQWNEERAAASEERQRQERRWREQRQQMRCLEDRLNMLEDAIGYQSVVLKNISRTTSNLSLAKADGTSAHQVSWPDEQNFHKPKSWTMPSSRSDIYATLPGEAAASHYVEIENLDLLRKRLIRQRPAGAEQNQPLNTWPSVRGN